MIQEIGNDFKEETLENNMSHYLEKTIRDRKKKKIAICIPTYNRPKILIDTCSKILNTVDERIFDIYIYDSSINSDSEKIIKEYIQKENFFYVRLPSTIYSNEKLYMIYQDKNIQNTYEYLWILADYMFFSNEVIEKIIKKLDEKWDMLMLDIYDPKRQGNKQYYDPNQIFFEYAWSMTLFGIIILNCKTILERADWPYLKEKYLKEQHMNFSHLAMYFEMMLKINNLRFYHFFIEPEDVYISEYKGRGNKSEYFRDFLNIWGRYWYASIHALPNYYTRKDQVITKACVYTGNLGKKNILALRTLGVLNIKSFYKCKDIWKVISTVKPSFVWIIVLLPKFIVKIIAYTENITNYAKKINVDIKRKRLKVFCKKYEEIYMGQVLKLKKWQIY